VLADCGTLGLDWERLSLSAYMEAVEANNERNEAPGKAPADVDRLGRLVAARTRH